MFLIGLGTAAPPGRYEQAECWAALQSSPQFLTLEPRGRAVLRKVLSGENGIVTRHLSLDKLTDAFDMTPDAQHARFAKNAPLIATEAAERALESARMDRAGIDALIISTCTGYLCPGLTSYVSERLGLRADALSLDLVGQGCGAAVPNLRTADALLAGGRAKNVLSICVEICSAAYYLDDDPGVLISACLFGDGAGAAILSAELAPHARRVEWELAGTALCPADREFLRFETRAGLLRNILGPKVPEIAAGHAARVFSEVLGRAELSQADINGWIFHAGGREVLRALQKELGLSDSDLRLSAAVLREYGNVSSPSVYFVLQEALKERMPGGWWWLSSFGAGFSCHGALLKVD